MFIRNSDMLSQKCKLYFCKDDKAKYLKSYDLFPITSKEIDGEIYWGFIQSKQVKEALKKLKSSSKKGGENTNE